MASQQEAVFLLNALKSFAKENPECLQGHEFNENHWWRICKGAGYNEVWKVMGQRFDDKPAFAKWVANNLPKGGANQ